MNPALRRLCGFFYRIRNQLAGLPLLYAFLSTRWEWENHEFDWTVALTLCMAGIALRAWGISHCLYSHGPVQRLATGGPYRFVRNPLYLANTMVVAGATAASELEWMIPVSVAWCLGIYALVIRDEERRLLAAYGDEYRVYRESVPAWLPLAHGNGSGGPPSARFLPLALRQSLQLAYLLPFLLKEFKGTLF